MTKYVSNLVLGLIASFVPIIMIGYQIERDDSIEFDYINFVRNAPIFFAIFNLIYIYIIDNYTNIDNYFIIGAIAGLIISSFGRFIMDIPTKVFKLPDPNMFHIYGMVTWSLFYGVIFKYLQPRI